MSNIDRRGAQVCANGGKKTLVTIEWPENLAPGGELRVLRAAAKGLGTYAKEALTAIWEFRERTNGAAWPSQKTLCEDTEMSERALRNALKALEARGLVIRTLPSANRRAGQSTVYQIPVPPLMVASSQSPAPRAGDTLLAGANHRHHVPLGTANHRHHVPPKAPDPEKANKNARVPERARGITAPAPVPLSEALATVTGRILATMASKQLSIGPVGQVLSPAQQGVRGAPAPQQTGSANRTEDPESIRAADGTGTAGD